MREDEKYATRCAELHSLIDIATPFVTISLSQASAGLRPPSLACSTFRLLTKDSRAMEYYTLVCLCASGYLCVYVFVSVYLWVCVCSYVCMFLCVCVFSCVSVCDSGIIYFYLRLSYPTHLQKKVRRSFSVGPHCRSGGKGGTIISLGGDRPLFLRK